MKVTHSQFFNGQYCMTLTDDGRSHEWNQHGSRRSDQHHHKGYVTRHVYAWRNYRAWAAQQFEQHRIFALHHGHSQRKHERHALVGRRGSPFG